jgi:DNA-binding transcriptional ArsR family regulator
VAAQVDADPVDARVVKALGHPTRVHILNVLRDREMVSPVELSAELGIALGTVGYHVRRLEQLGFIELARRTQRRGAVEHHYRARQVLDEAVAADAVAVAPTAGRGAEAVAVAHLSQAALANGGFDALLAHADRRVLALDAHGHAELERLLARWQTAVERVTRASAKRLAHATQPPPRRCAAVLMCFELPPTADEG